jgi:HEAT repeat protein
MKPTATSLIAALTAANASTRLRAALAIGSHPDPSCLDILVARCAIEPDFFVRDMLTWALTRLPSGITVPRLVAELQSDIAQARSQALHTLSKIKDSDTFHAITQSLLRDRDDEVARSAWRAAVILVPAEHKTTLAEELTAQLGRGDRDVQLSLTRALVALGPEVIEPLLRTAMASAVPRVRAHAIATERLLRDPDTGVVPHPTLNVVSRGSRRSACDGWLNDTRSSVRAVKAPTNMLPFQPLNRSPS